MEERVLRTLQSRKILDIINNQHINRLVEIQEIRDTVRLGSLLVLQLESVCTHVQHTRLRVQHTNLVADGIGQVRLTHSATSVDEQRVKGRTARLLSNRHTCRTRQLIRLARNKRIKRILRIQLRFKRVGYCLLPEQRLRTCGLLSGRRKHRSGSRSRINQHTVFQLGTLTKHAVILLNVLRHELRFDLKYQHPILILQRYNGGKPHAIYARREVVRQNGLTCCPLLL